MIEIFHNNKCSVRHAHDSVFFVGWALPTIGPQPGYLWWAMPTLLPMYHMMGHTRGRLRVLFLT